MDGLHPHSPPAPPRIRGGGRSRGAGHTRLCRPRPAGGAGPPAAEPFGEGRQAWGAQRGKRKQCRPTTGPSGWPRLTPRGAEAKEVTRRQGERGLRTRHTESAKSAARAPSEPQLQGRKSLPPRRKPPLSGPGVNRVLLSCVTLGGPFNLPSRPTHLHAQRC